MTIERRRELLLSAAFAVWGLTIAIALLVVWRRPAPPDQMMGLAKTLGFDAHGPMRWVLGLMFLPLLVPLVLRPVARLLANGAAWARNAAMLAPLVTLWLVTAQMSVARALVPCAVPAKPHGLHPVPRGVEGVDGGWVRGGSGRSLDKGACGDMIIV